MIRYKFTLTNEEKADLLNFVHKGKHSSLKFRNAYILLNSDQGNSCRHTTAQIAEFLQVNARTIERVKKRFVDEGIEICLTRKKTDIKSNLKVDGDLEAHLIALSCSEAPEGYSKWSLRMLADKVVELNLVDSISHETVRRVLKKRIEALES